MNKKFAEWEYYAVHGQLIYNRRTMEESGIELYDIFGPPFVHGNIRIVYAKGEFPNVTYLIQIDTDFMRKGVRDDRKPSDIKNYEVSHQDLINAEIKLLEIPPKNTLIYIPMN